VTVNVEVAHWREKWEVRELTRDHNSTPRWPAVARYRWKFQAVLVARFYCRNLAERTKESVELVIKNRNGRIAEKNTYGYDPEASKG